MRERRGGVREEREEGRSQGGERDRGAGGGTIDIHGMDPGEGVEEMEIHLPSRVWGRDSREGSVFEELSLDKV
jgi:hypothetical protein